jgi:probable FeS assembly SUF system protein SufT
MTQLQDDIALVRPCVAMRIPSGDPVLLMPGDRVRVTQSLGGQYTVLTEVGELVRIAAEDVEALGIEAPEQRAAGQGEFSEEKLWEQLRQVFDPEIPVNIVDLGLVYECSSETAPEGGHLVSVRMSMTAPGCGMGDVLRDDVRRRLMSVPGVRAAEVELVWDPPWTPDRMSEAARLQLGWM